MIRNLNVRRQYSYTCKASAYILLILIFNFVSSGCNDQPAPNDRLNLNAKLSGTWKAIAFDGALHEKWALLPDGYMQQEGMYIENRDTLYQAITKIEQVGTELILYSVIKDSNPKIFKAIHRTEDIIIFENKDYSNPYQVKYEFLSDNKYRRTIEGVENDTLAIYVFNFNKVD